MSSKSVLEILLVTSRQTRRWIIPKGWPIKGLKPPKSAAREAYEEAGIRGTMGGKSIGAFSYAKRLDDNAGIIPCEVRVFAMRVKRQLATWPEASERQTRWFEPEVISTRASRGRRHGQWTPPCDRGFRKKDRCAKKTQDRESPALNPETVCDLANRQLCFFDSLPIFLRSSGKPPAFLKCRARHAA